MNNIHLNQQLNCFDQSDTAATVLGTLGAGDYDLIELKENYPDSDTDYARVFDPGLNTKVWICSRYKDTRYASVNASETSTDPAPVASFDFDQDDQSIDEQQLVDSLQQFTGFTYHLQEPNYPFSLNGIKVPLASEAGQPQNNCCTFVEGLLVHAWQTASPGFSWNNTSHGQMMIYSADDYFSPVTCLVERGMAVAVPDDNTPPQPWTVIQGWREQWKGGHTFIILDYHAPTGRVLTLESNSGYNLNGVGYRNIGNISEHPHPTAQWWENERLWTWEKVKSAYAYRKQAKLKVKNVSWV